MDSQFKSSFFKNTWPEQRAIIKNTDIFTNVNANTTFTVVPLNNTTRIDQDFSQIANGFRVNRSGWLDVESLMVVKGFSARVNPQTAIAVNGVPLPTRSNTYIRYSSSHTEGTLFVKDFIYVNSGDEITLMSRAEAAFGGAYMLEQDCTYLQLRFEPIVGLLATESRPIFLLVAEESGALGSNAYDFAFGDGEKSATHGVVVPRSGKISAFGFRSGTGTGSVRIELLKNGNTTGVYIDVPLNQATVVINLQTKYQLAAGDLIYFRTITPGSRSNCSITTLIELDAF